MDARLMLDIDGMNTQTTLGIRPGARRAARIVTTKAAKSAGRHSEASPIPSATAIRPPLIVQLAAEHAAVLEKWKRKFALDLHRPRAA
jgi:hypothetical protein